MIEALWSAKVRYGLTAALCLVLNNGIMVAADTIGMSLASAASAAFCIMVVIGYLLLSGWTYSVERSWTAFGRYVGAMAFNFPITLGMLWVVRRGLDEPMAIASPIASLSVTAINVFSSYWAVAGRQATPVGRA